MEKYQQQNDIQRHKLRSQHQNTEPEYAYKLASSPYLNKVIEQISLLKNLSIGTLIHIRLL